MKKKETRNTKRPFKSLEEEFKEAIQEEVEKARSTRS